MSKRGSTSGRPESVKKPRSVQSTLGRYLTASSTSITSTKRTTVLPQDFGIHVYTTQEIEHSKGLMKEYRKFWNAKSMEYCKEKRVTSKMDGAAIKGAINTSWLLHKSTLLEFQSQQIEERAAAVYSKASIDHILAPIKRNLDRVKIAKVTMDMLYEELTEIISTQDKSAKEKEMEQATTELKRALDALQKALQRKEHDIQESLKTTKDEVPANVTTIPELSVAELDDLVDIVTSDSIP